MQLPVGTESVTIQFAPYLEEFHEFFTMVNLTFGAPEDLTVFIERLSEPGAFRENVSALIWSIMFREQEQISVSALANLLAVAVGGARVEDEAGKMEGPLRVLLLFVLGVMRSGRNMPPKELPFEKSESRQQLQATDKPAGPLRESEYTRTPTAASQIESSNSETRAPFTEKYEDKPRVFGRPQKIAGGLIIGLTLLAGVVLLVRHDLSRTIAIKSTVARDPVLSGADRKNDTAEAPWCVNPQLSLSSRNDLEGRYRAAKTLVDQNRPSEALPRLQEVALVDPGFPMINLNISEAWFKLRQIDEAKAALDAQYAVSGCLAKLPVAELRSYCSAELPNATLDSCRTQIAGIWQAAHTQGTLMQLAMERGGAPASAALAAKSRAAAKPEAEAYAIKKTTALEPRPSRRSSDRSLVDGEGTDASLGAYPK